MTEHCGTCAHSNEDEAPERGETYCTKAGGFYHGRIMQLTAFCEAWECSERAARDEAEAEHERERAGDWRDK